LFIKNNISIIILACGLLLINCGCIFEDNNELRYSITKTNLGYKDLWMTVYIDDKVVEEGLCMRTLEDDRSICDSRVGLHIKPGIHKLEILVTYENGTMFFNEGQTFKVSDDFDIEIQLTEDDVYIYIRNWEDERKNNNPPQIKDGKYEKLNNTTYRFSVIYFDSEADEPTDAQLIIYHKQLLPENNYHEYSLFCLGYHNGSLYTGALFQVEVAGFSETDDYRFAFYDGYDMAIPVDDTPYAEPIL